MSIAVYRALYRPYCDPEDHMFSIVASDVGAWYAVPSATAVDEPHISDSRVADSLAICYQDGEKPETPEEWAIVAAFNLGSDIQYVLVDSNVYDGESVSEILELETMRTERASLLRDAAEQGGNAAAVTMPDYSSVYDGPDDHLIAVVCWNHPSKGTAERINGEWVPMDDIQLDSINMKRIDSVTEGVIALTDQADQSRSDLTRTDVMPFVIPRESRNESP